MPHGIGYVYIYIHIYLDIYPFPIEHPQTNKYHNTGLCIALNIAVLDDISHQIYPSKKGIIGTIPHIISIFHYMDIIGPFIPCSP